MIEVYHVPPIWLLIIQVLNLVAVEREVSNDLSSLNLITYDRGDVSEPDDEDVEESGRFPSP